MACARLQACPSSLKLEKGDVNPKDHIVFAPSAFEPVLVVKDNTGKGEYIEAACGAYRRPKSIQFRDVFLAKWRFYMLLYDLL